MSPAVPLVLRCCTKGAHDEIKGAHDEIKGTHDEIKGAHNEIKGAHDEIEARVVVGVVAGTRRTLQAWMRAPCGMHRVLIASRPPWAMHSLGHCCHQRPWAVMGSRGQGYPGPMRLCPCGAAPRLRSGQRLRTSGYVRANATRTVRPRSARPKPRARTHVDRTAGRARQPPVVRPGYALMAEERRRVWLGAAARHTPRR